MIENIVQILSLGLAVGIGLAFVAIIIGSAVYGILKIIKS